MYRGRLQHLMGKLFSIIYANCEHLFAFNFMLYIKFVSINTVRQDLMIGSESHHLLQVTTVMLR